MKKYALLLCLSMVSMLSYAQEGPGLIIDQGFIKDMAHTLSVLAAFILLAVFIITMTKMILDFRLKTRMIEKGLSENSIMQFLSAPKTTRRHQAMKWFSLLSGLGLGLLLMGIFRPYGLHSLVLVTFCIAAAFLGYFFYLRRSEHGNNH